MLIESDVALNLREIESYVMIRETRQTQLNNIRFYSNEAE